MFPASPNPEGDELAIAMEAFNPGLDEASKKIINLNSSDELLQTYATLMQLKQDGEKFAKTKLGGSVDIDEAIGQVLTEIGAKYPDLSLGG